MNTKKQTILIVIMALFLAISIGFSIYLGGYSWIIFSCMFVAWWIENYMGRVRRLKTENLIMNKWRL